MNSNREVITIPIGANLDQSANPFASEPGTLLKLVNLRLEETGRLVKRRGYHQSQVSGSAPRGAVRMLALGKSVLAIDQDKIWSLDSYNDWWDERDRTPPVGLASRRHVIGEGNTSIFYPCAAATASFVMHAWEVSSEVWVLVTDVESGSVVLGPVSVTPGVTTHLPRVLAGAPGYFYVFYILGTSVRMKYIAATEAGIQAGTFSSENTLLTDLETTDPGYDVTFLNTNGSPRYGVAYNYDAGAGDRGLKVRSFSHPTTAVNTYTLAGQCRTVSVCSNLGEDYVWVLKTRVATPGSVDVRVLNTSLSSLASIDNTLGPGSGNVVSTGMQLMPTSKILAACSTDLSGLGSRNATYWSTYTTDGATITKGTTVDNRLLGSTLASQPFSYDGQDVAAWLDIGSNTTARLPYDACVLVRMTHDSGSVYTGAPYSTLGPHSAMPYVRVAGGRAAWGMYTTAALTGTPLSYVAPQRVTAHPLDTRQFIWDACVRQRPPTSLLNTVTAEEITVRKIDISDTVGTLHVPCNAGRIALTSGGGQVMQWDGQSFAELGFVEPPGHDGGTPDTTGGSIAAGSYQYAFTYEFVDFAGQRHQSAPIFSSVVTHGAGSTNKVTFLVQPLRCTTKQDIEFASQRVLIVMWRTLAGPDGIYRRVKATTNDATQVTQTIVDTASDATVAANEPLYVSQGELEHAPPPPSRHVVSFGNRIAGIDAEFPTRIWFSKPLKFDEGHSHSPALEQYVNGIGELTALAEQDGTLFAFSATGIAAAAFGDGIDPTGGGSWQSPQVIATGMGCVDARAIATCSVGIVFGSKSDGATRIWLLPRGGGPPQEIGSKVREELDTYVNITSCITHADESLVLITVISNAVASEILAFDYGNGGAWYVWDGMAGNLLRTATVAAGKHWVAGSSNTDEPYYQHASSFKDSRNGTDSWVAWTVRTADIRIGGMAPFGKLLTVIPTFEYQDKAKVTITVSLDQSLSTAAVGAVVVAGDTAGRIIQRHWEPDLRRLYSESGFRLQMQSAAPDTTTTNSADVLPRAITLDYLALPGTLRPRGSERMTA